MASNADLPKWAWDLIIALLNHEDEHGGDSVCMNSVVSAVPMDVRDQAEAIRTYVRSAGQSDLKDRIEAQWAGLTEAFAMLKPDKPSGS